jgi:hypothetical protein
VSTRFAYPAQEDLIGNIKNPPKCSDKIQINPAWHFADYMVSAFFISKGADR